MSVFACPSVWGRWMAWTVATIDGSTKRKTTRMQRHNTNLTPSLVALPPEIAALNDALEARTRQLEERHTRLNTVVAKTTTRGRKPRAIDNPLFGVLTAYTKATEELYHGYPLWLDDVLNGVARLDWYRTTGRSIPLSVKRLTRILDSLPTISTASITTLLLLEERQARRYMTAIELAMPYLLKGMPEELKQRRQEEAANDELFTPEDFDSYFGNELQSVG